MSDGATTPAASPASGSSARDTPAMRQHARFKRQHPDCVLFFRIGDFYELFDDDAVLAHRVLGLTLTQRTAGIPMAGVPFHQLDLYLRRLIAAGHRVAVCDQLQDASEAKGVIERGVTRVVTPGTLVDAALLEEGEAAPVAAVCVLDEGDAPGARAALAVAEVSTGSFAVLTTTLGGLADALASRSVRELLYAETADGRAPERVARAAAALGIPATARAAWHFRSAEALEALTQQFGVRTLAGFGLRDDADVVRPAGAVLRYLLETQPGAGGAGLGHLRPPREDVAAGTLHLDAATLRSLEVERTMRAGTPDGSLLGVFSGAGRGGARTAMGRRLLRDWLCRPSGSLAEVRSRQAAVAVLVEDRRTAGAVGEACAGVQDIARIAARVALRRATPRDLVALGRSLVRGPRVREALEGAPALGALRARIDGVAGVLDALGARIESACVPEPPAHLREGGVIRDGFDAALDEARGLQRDAGAWLSAYQRELIEAHGLPSLKVGYNRVFGYFIELPRAQARQAPAAFVRRQTLANAERFVTPELSAFEERVTGAERRAVDREQALVESLCVAASEQLGAIGVLADALAELDVLLAFADKAHARGWTRPELVEEPVLEVHAGRHPVLDESLGSAFVPNDAALGTGHGEGARLALITGPNMAGKSTFIRQAALLVLLAHTGSFLPADRATIGLTDRIFTRVGADDALHAGQSTFMVEMTETANILHHATASSLVILDEIGRGTSTLDGLSLAWAITEFLAGEGRVRPRTLFATHYHELTDLQERLGGRVVNLHVEVREWQGSVVFLHRIRPGRASQSYGIHVARLAGLPASVVARAREVLDSLAVHHAGGVAGSGGSAPGAGGGGDVVPAARPPSRDGQMGLFTEYLDHPAVAELREMPLESMTPIEAFDALRRLRERVTRA